ncbi:MAG: hypothetical protein JSW00_08505 [Thermoplasmata archaeon]|nr:MAG: hypothetical protein JSW00_08505 [Thermoplasmata archaeon]
MKKIVITFGILLAVTILMSGSAVAPWIIDASLSIDCENVNDAVGAPDNSFATAGTNPSTLGTLVLDFGVTNAMPPSTTFTVYGGSTENESYGVEIKSIGNTTDAVLGIGWDGADYHFTTPSTPGIYWQWVLITGATGQTSFEDPIYGPEIDAVGY